MSPIFSLYLDLVRFAAAGAVFLDHLSSAPITENLLWRPLGAYGVVAVTIFFVLSGYVIAFVTSNRENDWVSYGAARFSRMYSVVLIALPLTLACDVAGMILNPDFYGSPKVLAKPESVTGYLSSFFFVNEWRIFDLGGISPGTNGPYWSLSFEVTYYVAIGLFLFAPRLPAIVSVVLLFFLAGNTITAMFPLWLAGYAAYFVRLPKISRPLFVSLAVLTTAVVAAAPAVTRSFDGFGPFLPFGRNLSNRNLACDYLVAVAFVVQLSATRAFFVGTDRPPRAVAKTIKWLGSLTFPLYCIHYPVLCLAAAVVPWPRSSWMVVPFEIAVVFAVVAVAAPLADALKTRLRTAVEERLRSAAPNPVPDRADR